MPFLAQQRRSADRFTRFAALNEGAGAELAHGFGMTNVGYDLLGSLLRSATDLIVCADLEGRILAVSDSMVAATGFSKERLVALRSEDLMHPEEISEMVEQREAVLLTGRPVQLQCRIARADGTFLRAEMTIVFDAESRTMLATGRPLSDAPDAPATPVTTAVATELANRSASVLYLLDLVEDRIVFATESAPHVLGLAQGTVVGMPLATFTEHIEPQDVSLVVEKHDRLCMSEPGQFIDCEFRWRMPDGRTRWLWTRETVQTRDANGHPLQAAGTIHDVTERRLREDGYRLLFESHPSPMWVYDVETRRFLDVNESAVRHYGYSREEFLTMRLDDIRPSEDMPELMQAVQAPESFVGHVWRHLRRDGSVMLVVIESSPLTYRGTSARFVAVRDVTDEVAAREERDNLNEILQQRVRLRTEELEASNRELESFCFSVSHDLRGPLRAIDGFSKALEQDYRHRLDAEGLDYLGRVRRAAQRLSDLIDALLSLSRITRLSLEVSTVDITAITSEILSTMQAQERERGVIVEVEDGLAAKGDPRLIRALLQILLENAWKFTSKADEPRIWVRRDGEAFLVKDNGAGFDMQFAHKLFRPFERLHRSEEFVGNGIGLATAERIVKRHGGRIWAEGAVGYGAQIRFTLGSGSADRTV